MNFCENCDNMLYMKIITKEQSDSDESENKDKQETQLNNKIIYYCRCCNNEYPDLYKKNSCIFKLNYNLESITKNSFINDYIYDDITLPRAENIKCPNKDCPGKSKPDIKYIQYDKDEMKYIYICNSCYKAGIPKHIW